MSKHLIFNDTFLHTQNTLDKRDVNQIETLTNKSVKQLKSLDNSKEIGFLELPFRQDDIIQVKKIVSEIPTSIKNIVVLGIGGSSLGPQALYSSLKSPFYHFNQENRRLFFPDNVDPLTFTHLLDFLKFEETIFLVTTKSGGTAETASQFMIVWQRLIEYFGEDVAKEHIIAITDPSKGNLRILANELNLKTAPIPSNVGGRFSVLSPVGLLPAALIGIDIDELLAGAAYWATAFREISENNSLDFPPIKAAVSYYLLHTKYNKTIHVLMPYSDSLYSTALWFNQLWGESLGKRKDLNGKDIFTGPTPVASRGTTDQHSQLQLYVEGPSDKIITFLTVENLSSIVPIPSVFSHIDSYSYLGGHSMNELLNIEQKATALALYQNNRPSAELKLPDLSPSTMGEVFMFFQIVTALSGGLYNINPFDQPGVEQGKKYTYGALGRKGFEKEAKIMTDFLK